MSCVYRKKNHLYLQIDDENGKRRQVATGLRVGQEAKAQRLLVRLEAQIKAGREVMAGAAGPVTVAAFCMRWLDEREPTVADIANDRARLRDHVLPVIGELRIEEVRPRHLIDVFRVVRQKLAPRTVRNVYSVVKALFRDAMKRDLIHTSPCILDSHDLGKVVDKDPEWREGAVYTRAELEQLISDPRIPADRQVLYALEGIAMLRHGEAAALRWRHYDPTAEPLGRLLIAVSNHSERTKTGETRRMPVHPVLAAMLVEWKLSGWQAIMGRQPEPDDLIVPLPLVEPARKRWRSRPNPRAGDMRSKNDSGKRHRSDLEALGWRHRRGHDLRATGISLALDDGANERLILKGTHKPKERQAFDSYVRTRWVGR